jgi:type II secretory pathway pseudopilin PulG
MLGFWKKNKAFTLAEILIVFTIIGIVSSLILMTTKRMAASDKYAYQRAYDSVWTAAYNASAEPGAPALDTPENLCKGMAKYINSQNATNPIAGSGHGTDDGFCNAIVAASRPTKLTDEFKDLTPDFIANNGMRFYISKKITANNVADFEGVRQNIDFFIVYADIDGERGQNSISSGDVVAFAVTPNADVIPLGLPAYDKHYFVAKVVFPETKTHPNERLSDAMTYYDAIHNAWGGRILFDDLRTIDFNSLPVLAGAKFLEGVTVPAAPAQHNDCICDHEDKPACLNMNPPNPNGTRIIDRFDCDLKIERYY